MWGGGEEETERNKNHLQQNLTADTILSSEILNINFKNRKRTCFVLSIQHCTGGFSQCKKARKTNKNIYIGNEELRLFLFVDDMITYRENHMESMKNVY